MNDGAIALFCFLWIGDLVQLDPDVQQWFQDQGDQYTTLINSVLRQYIEEKANADRPKPL